MKLGLGRGARSEASLKAAKGVGSQRGLDAHRPSASRPRRPSAALLAPDP